MLTIEQLAKKCRLPVDILNDCYYNAYMKEGIENSSCDKIFINDGIRLIKRCLSVNQLNYACYWFGVIVGSHRIIK